MQRIERARDWHARATFRIGRRAELRDGILVVATDRLVTFFAAISLVNLVHGSRDWVEYGALAEATSRRRRRAAFIDGFLMASVIGMTLALVADGFWADRGIFRSAVVAAALYRVVDILQANLTMALLDPHLRPGRPLTRTAAARPFVNSMGNLTEIMLAFAILSRAVGDRFIAPVDGTVRALYHSFATQSLLGSPHKPTEWLSHLMVIVHASVSFLFVLLVVGRWFNELGSRPARHARRQGSRTAASRRG